MSMFLCFHAVGLEITRIVQRIAQCGAYR